MAIYLVAVFLIISSYFALKKITSNYKKIYCFFVFAVLFLVMAFRDTSMGTDLNLYVPYFNIIKGLSFSEVIEFCKVRDTEVLFYLITKFISLFTKNVHVYLAIVSIPYLLASSRFIYKYSKNPVISFLLFLALNYYCFSFSAIRHTIAAAFLIFSYDYLREKKLFKFLVMVLLAGCMHRSALIFLIAYPILKLKINWRQLVIIFISLFLAIFCKNIVLEVIFMVVSSGHYLYYESNGGNLSLTFCFINLLIYIFMIYLHGNKKDEIQTRSLLNLQFLCVCFSAFSAVLAEIFRIGLYFGVFVLAGLPNAIEASKIKGNKPIYNVIISLFSILYFLLFTLYNNDLVPYVSIFS